MFSSLIALDGNILLFIQNNLRSPVLTPVMKAVTHLGDKGIFWVILTLILMIPKKTRRAALCSVFAVALSYLICNLTLKHLVNRIRPYEVIDGLKLLVGKADDASFPSGHSSASFASSVALARSLPDTWKKAGIVLIILAAIIALSRLYVGIHYPTDVICGTIIGIICGFAGSDIGKRVSAYLKGRGSNLFA